MSHFYGTLQGNRGEATRAGSKKSGIMTYAASWAGAVCVTAYVRDDVDWVSVSLVPWQGEGTRALLYDGPIGGPHDQGSDVDKALRCRTCLHFKNWESFVSGPEAPDNKGDSDGVA